MTRGPLAIVGAGPTGALLAILLERRGLATTLYDARPDPRGHAGDAGRSINLALADRGLHALEQAGVLPALADALMPMRGRMIHARDGGQSLQPYGQRAREVIYSVSRHRLNQVLLEVAAAEGATLEFNHRLEDLDFTKGTARLRHVGRARDGAEAPERTVALQPLLAADGAGSVARRRMAALGLIAAREVDLAHGYKELTVPSGIGGAPLLAADALHIWPRGNFMLIALPNADGSFTATLFLANQGAPRFAALDTPGAIEDFLQREFPDACALMPDRLREFETHPTGFLGTVYADGWHADQVCLLGDAAHAIVPFHGQGMNCCFEDCMTFAACLDRDGALDDPQWPRVFAAFFAERKANTDAIAAMAIDNYLEMRERVADPRFMLQQTLALELERRHPGRFIPRYAMVMFHHEIPYATAQARGAVQARLLADLTDGIGDLGGVDFDLARSVIERDLPLIDVAGQA
jgi:kynurenine 3-monooxygenase